jgi:hypothetical protein
MRSFINKIFNFSKDNDLKTSRFKLIEKCLIRNINLDTVNRIYYVGGLEYSKENLNEVLKSIKDKTLLDFFEKNRFNTLVDNIELYYIENKDGKSNKISLILSPYEFLENEQLIEVVEVDKIDFLESKKDVELIYSDIR